MTKSTPTSILSKLPRSHDVLEHQLLSVWVDAAHVGLCVVDDTARVVMLNPGACRKLGVDGAEVLNKPLKTLLRGISGDASLVQWLSTPGFDGERQVTVQAIEGVRHLLLKTHSVRTATGEHFKVVAITDVTQLTEALYESAMHRRQWQAVNAGVVLSDARAPDMPITYVNPVFERMTGYSSAEVLGRNCRFLQGGDLNQPGLVTIREAVKNQTNGYALLRNYRKDGSLFLNELFISPVKDAEGVITHFLGIQHLRVWEDSPGKPL